VTGLRGIIVHQVRDRESDLAAGVRTFAGALPAGTARTLLFRRIYPAELLALSVMLSVLIPDAPILIAVLPLYFLVELLRILDDWRLPLLDPENRAGDPYVPVANNELYEVWLPFSLGIQLALSALPYAVLPVAQLIVFLPNIQERLKDLASLSPVLRWFFTGQGRAPLCIAPYSESDASALGFTARRLSDDMIVFVAVTHSRPNAVTVFSANLVRGLKKRGQKAALLLCGDSEPDRPVDVPVVALRDRPDSRWGSDWVAIVRFLEHQAPCIYVPNAEPRFSSLVPLLSDKIGIARVAHHDYDQIEREYDKIFTIQDGMWKPEHRRSNSPLGRVAAFARLALSSGKRRSSSRDVTRAGHRVSLERGLGESAPPTSR
jgi:hypothetical protein